MSLARGKFGIEYDPERKDRPSGLGRAAALVLAAVAVALAFALFKRLRAPSEELALVKAAGELAESDDPEPELPSLPVPRDFDEVYATLHLRKGRVRTLLMRLKEAQAQGDLKAEVATIGQLRDLPGNSALDLNNLLANRLGELNLNWLFERHNPMWVKKLVAKSGDSASMIAQANGSTLASLRRLNPDKDIDRLRVGDEILVMDRPHFCLCVYPNTRKADLQLNGQFFKRYALREAVTGNAGTYEAKDGLRQFLAAHGVWFQLADRQELETLLPRKFTLAIGDL